MWWHETCRGSVLGADGWVWMDGLRAASAGSGSGVLFDPSVSSLRGAESGARTTAGTPDLFIAWPFYKPAGTAVGCSVQHVPASLLHWAAHTETLWTDECTCALTFRNGTTVKFRFWARCFQEVQSTGRVLSYILLEPTHTDVTGAA